MRSHPWHNTLRPPSTDKPREDGTVEKYCTEHGSYRGGDFPEGDCPKCPTPEQAGKSEEGERCTCIEGNDHAVATSAITNCPVHGSSEEVREASERWVIPTCAECGALVVVEGGYDGTYNVCSGCGRMDLQAESDANFARAEQAESALQAAEAEVEKRKREKGEAECLLGEYGAGGTPAGLIGGIHNLAHRAEAAESQIKELRGERTRLDDLAKGNYEQACRFRDELFAAESRIEALKNAIGQAGYYLDPNQGERPDPVAAYQWLRTTYPEDHPNYVSPADLGPAFPLSSSPTRGDG